jgi:hypothetical protein
MGDAPGRLERRIVAAGDGEQIVAMLRPAELTQDRR